MLSAKSFFIIKCVSLALRRPNDPSFLVFVKFLSFSLSGVPGFGGVCRSFRGFRRLGDKKKKMKKKKKKKKNPCFFIGFLTCIIHQSKGRSLPPTTAKEANDRAGRGSQAP